MSTVQVTAEAVKVCLNLSVAVMLKGTVTGDSQRMD